jgi:uncharacterized membrane protein (UPF0127 family)
MSNETPNSETARTKSAPERAVAKRLLLAWGLLAAILLVILLIGRLDGTSVKVGSERLQLERVSTPEAREKGLSGRNSLPKDQGMLFVFAAPSQYCLWMKDMKFNIDIIWLDPAKKVIKIEENVAPSTYPNTFCPDKDAQYVIEVNAGVAKTTGIKLGAQLNVQ